MSNQVMAWGQGVQESDQHGANPSSVLVPTVQPPTDPGRESPYLSHTGSPGSPQDSSKQRTRGGLGRSRCSCRAPTGTRQHLGSSGKKGVSLAQRWLVAKDRGLERQHFSHRAWILSMSFASPSPVARNIPPPECPRPQACSQSTWHGHIPSGTPGDTIGSVGLCQETHPTGCLCHVPSSNFQQLIFSYHCPLPDPRKLGCSHLPESHHLPRCPLCPTRSSISLVEYPTVSWESWERGPCLRLIQAHTTPGNLAPSNGVHNALGLSQGLEGEERIVAVLEHACHGLSPSSQWWPV